MELPIQLCRGFCTAGAVHVPGLCTASTSLIVALVELVLDLQQQQHKGSAVKHRTTCPSFWGTNVFMVHNSVPPCQHLFLLHTALHLMAIDDLAGRLIPQHRPAGKCLDNNAAAAGAYYTLVMGDACSSTGRFKTLTACTESSIPNFHHG